MIPRPASLTATAALMSLLAAACASGGVSEPTDTPPATVGSAPADSPASPTPTTPEPGPRSPSPPSLDDVRLGLEVVAEGLDSPVFVTPLLGTDDLLALEQPGRVARITTAGEVTPWLDLSDRVGSGGNEQGLLGLALHPDFPDDDRVFAHYTDREGATTLDVLRATPDGADPASRTTLLSVDQPASNHNGGMLTFHGPDDLLYLALGDGGAAADRFGNGQDPSTLLGAILRLDVDAGDPYGIPPGNPFAGGERGAPEVWVYGLRNPWRFTFDGDRLFIGDVGQNAFEEISTMTVADRGANFGWPITEGDACFDPPEGCDREGLTPPILTYETGPGGTCSVIAGPAYRGEAIPGLQGHVFYSDFCAGFLRGFRFSGGRAVEQRDWTEQVGVIDGATSFGLDHAGEVLVTSRAGRVLRLVPASSSP